MSLRFFVIPVQDIDAATAELNSFLSSHKILTIDRNWVDLGSNSYWALCVNYLQGGGNAVPARNNNVNRSRIDYKEILAPVEFDVFSRLRELRKELAQKEAIPVYALFTNEQLAQIVQQRCQTKSDLAKIDGIGESKIDKYADHLLPLLVSLRESKDAPNSKSV